MIKFDQYQITTLGEPFKLHRRHQKYWEIKYEQSSGTVLIRCGRLLPNHVEDESTVITCRKKFETLNAIKDFMNKSINIKIRKGYKFFRDTRSTLPTRKTSEEKMPIAPPDTSSNLVKRPNPNLQDNTIPGFDINKAIHSDLPNPFIPVYPHQNFLLAKPTPQDSFSSYSQSQSQSKTSLNKFIPLSQEPLLRKPDLASPLSQLTPGPGPVIKKKEVNSQIKEEEEDFSLKSPTGDFKAADIEAKRDEFMKKVDTLKTEECPFGKPTFGSHGTITTASKWESEDPRGWYISEKLGGIRCLWNGLEMWSKNGTQYNIPDYFISRLPKSPLDGELYMERGTLSKCMMIVKKKSTDPDYEKEWNNMWFVVYDAPEAPGNFRQRLQALKEYFEKSDGLYIRLHEYRICEGKADAQRELEQIQKEGGEGIVLREGNSPYTKGRSKFVLERRSHFEARAEVIEHIKGKSKSGSEIVASLRVRTADGKEFLINRGITDDIRQHPPAVGSEIIYKFSGELDSGKPKAPVFIKAADKD